MNDELISVIMPTYNRGYIIKLAIDSIINQTYKNIELIIVDDCSEDNTDEIVSSYYYDERVIYIKLEEKKGANFARNVGLEKAKGNFITFQDSDDYSFPERLEKEFNYLKEHNADLVFSSFYKTKSGNEKYLLDGQSEKINKKVFPNKKIKSRDIYNILLYKNIVTTQVLFGKKSVFVDEKFDDKISRFQDWDLMIRIASKYKVYHLAEPLLYLFVQENSITKSYSKGLESLIVILQKYNDSFNAKQKCRILFRIGTFQMMVNVDATESFKEGLKLYKNAQYCLIYFLYKINLYKPIYMHLKK